MVQNHTPDSAISVFRTQDAVRMPAAEAVYVRYIPSRQSISVSVDNVYARKFSERSNEYPDNQ